MMIREGDFYQGRGLTLEVMCVRERTVWAKLYSRYANEPYVVTFGREALEATLAKGYYRKVGEGVRANNEENS